MEDLHSMLRNDAEQNYLCPTGFVFLTNMSYGYNFIDIKYNQSKATEKYQEYIEKIKSLGYIVQVTDAVNYKGNYISTPVYQNVAIYVKKEDDSEVNKSELFNI